jgi:hypothetical protein
MHRFVMRALPVDAVLRPGNAPDARLGVEPLIRPDELPFAWGVVTFRPIGNDTTSATHCHSSVGLGTVVLVEATAQLLLFR